MRTVVLCQPSIEGTARDINDRLILAAVEVMPQVHSEGQAQVGRPLVHILRQEGRLPVLPGDRVKGAGRAEDVEVEITKLAGELAQVLAPWWHVPLTEGHHQTGAQVGSDRGSLVLVVFP